MSKEKQIEEIAKTMCKNYGGCSKCMFFSSCDVKSFAMRLHEKGYRKASDVAREIFEQIERDAIHKMKVNGCKKLLFNEAKYDELKKKYIGKDTNVTTNTEEGK